MTILLIFVVISSLSIIGFSWYTGISPMPSSQAAKKTILQAAASIEAKMIYELGSGWGGLTFALKSVFPQSRVYAFEISHFPWLFSKILQKIKKKSDLEIYCKNFFDISLQKADLVVCYLYRDAMQHLKEKFEKELQPGTLVISNTFAIPGWTPIQIIEINDVWKSKVFVYNS